MLKLKTDTTNPIYERLTRHAHVPSREQAVRISIGIGIAAILFMRALISYDDRSVLVSLALLLAAVGTVISPAVQTIYAANLTNKDLRPENLQMMKLAGITQTVMIEGYSKAAFHRLRWLGVIATALFPTLIAGSFAMWAVSWTDLSLVKSGGILLMISLPVALFSLCLRVLRKMGCNLGASLIVSGMNPTLAMIAAPVFILIISSLVFSFSVGLIVLLDTGVILLLKGFTG